MPLHGKLGIPASTRASYYLYNSVDDVDKLIDSIYRVKKIFRT
jgi:cysteine desulfurase/selenocysteine lyase